MKLYRVQSISPAGKVSAEVEVQASSAEAAAEQVVEAKLSRGEKGRNALLCAKVYSAGTTGVTTLVRLYQRTERVP